MAAALDIAVRSVESKHAFTRYIDTHNNNRYLSDNVGKCNRLDNYHYTPRQYFADNPWRRDAQWENGKNIGKFPFSHSHSDQKRGHMILLFQIFLLPLSDYRVMLSPWHNTNSPTSWSTE